MLKPFTLCVNLFFLLCSISFAQAAGVELLRIGVGARAVAMGEGFVALANDVNACYWNPAGLAQLESREISATHLEYPLDLGIRYEYLAAASPIGENKALGFGFSYLYTDKMPVTEWDDPDSPYRRAVVVDELRAYSGMVSLSYAERIGDLFFLGVNFKFIQEKIYTDQGQAYAVDMGLLYQLLDNLRVGMAVQNLGTQMRLWRDSFPLPLVVKAGVAYQLAPGVSEENGFMLTCDSGWEQESGLDFRVGAEYWLGSFLAFRAGYKYMKENEKWVGLTTGGGFKIGNLKVDYAYVPQGDLGDTHRVSLTVQF